MIRNELANAHWVREVVWSAYTAKSGTKYLFWIPQADSSDYDSEYVYEANTAFNRLRNVYGSFENIPADKLQEFIDEYKIVTPEEYEIYFRKAVIIDDNPYIEHPLHIRPSLLLRDSSDSKVFGGVYMTEREGNVTYCSLLNPFNKQGGSEPK